MIKCEIDEKEFNNRIMLSNYLKKTYNMTSQEYYHKYIIKSDVMPTCGCGCGENTTWNSSYYRKFIRYHHIKVNNPWGHNKKAQEKSAETRRRQYASGERKPWSAGLSLETSDALRSAAKKLSDRYTPEIKKQYSEKMSKNRKNGTIPTRYGKDAAYWKGGISSIQQIARTYKKLYELWKYPILVRDGFKCTKCKKSDNLQVHHDKETFSEIIKRVMTPDDYEKITDFESKKQIADRIAHYHADNNISGITLCRDCHGEIHPSLNFKK